MLDKIYLEITNVCNLDCSFCHKTARAKKFMSEDEFELLLGKLEGKARYLFFHLMGEPTLHPLLPRFIEAARSKGFLPAITTNGSLLSEKGEALLSRISHLLSDTDDCAVNEQKAKTAEIMKRLPLADLSTERFGGGKTMELFDDPAWAELSSACLGCGTCTFVCPTCQCYDIKDFQSGEGVVRFRCWDSCMYSDFTKMSAGQPRLSQKERFRQRFMHKLVYFPERYGMFSCVGCGRCLARCPISMNIVKVMKSIGGDEK